MKRLRQTPSQTIGPFFAYGLAAEQYGYRYSSIIDGTLAGDHESGEKIYLVGNVFDGDNVPISDALVELWQADQNGLYKSMIDNRKKEFTGFGRLGTGADPGLSFRFSTVKPGSAGESQAPHINLILFMRGSLRQYHTRVYFSDETQANETDDVLNQVPSDRRRTMIATRRIVEGKTEYQFDIHMQGEKETVFFDLGT
jgi:protocatechuate 3,4-dioxygenase alpha subunit